MAFPSTSSVVHPEDSCRQMPIPQGSELPYNPAMSARESRPDALIIGAPKAGTSALHVALAQHPQIYASPVKEPKYFMCWDAPPPAYRGPGDGHSNQEWIWRREEYDALFRGAPDDAIRLESTPFYLYAPNARRRIAEELPAAKLIIIVRDPIDRAYSNWMHLWVDGLEPISDFEDAWLAEDSRVASRMGTVLALPTPWPVRRTAGRSAQPGGTRKGPCSSLLAAGVAAERDPEPHLTLSRHR